MRVTVNDDGEFFICFENIDKSSNTLYNKHLCGDLIKIINKIDDKSTLTPANKEDYTRDCKLIGDSIDMFSQFLSKVETLNKDMKNAGDLSKQIILLKELFQTEIGASALGSTMKGGRKRRRKLSKRILQKKRKSKKIRKIVKTKTRYLQFGGEIESKEKQPLDCLDILLVLDNSLYGETVNYMKRNTLITDSLCQISHKKLSEVINKCKNGIMSLQTKIWSSLLEEKVVGDRPPKWIEYKMMYVGEELIKKIGNYKKELTQLIQSVKDEMDKCKKDMIFSMIQQALEEIPETSSETGDMLLSIQKLVDLSVIISKLTSSNTVGNMTESRNKLLDKSDKICQFLDSDSNRQVLLENVKHNLLRYPEIIKKLTGKEDYPEIEELGSLRKTLSLV